MGTHSKLPFRTLASRRRRVEASLWSPSCSYARSRSQDGPANDGTETQAEFAPTSSFDAPTLRIRERGNRGRSQRTRNGLCFGPRTIVFLPTKGRKQRANCEVTKWAYPHQPSSNLLRWAIFYSASRASQGIGLCEARPDAKTAETHAYTLQYPLMKIPWEVFRIC